MQYCMSCLSASIHMFILYHIHPHADIKYISKLSRISFKEGSVYVSTIDLSTL